MRLAVDFPQKVERLILVDSATYGLTHRAARVSFFLRPLLPLAALFALHSRCFRRTILRSAVHDPSYLTPEVLEGYFRPTRMRGHLTALGRLLVDRRADPPLDPSAVTQPTLILWGEQDRWLPPSQGQRLHEQIRDSRLMLIPRAGHLPLEEQPEESNLAILDFLRES